MGAIGLTHDGIQQQIKTNTSSDVRQTEGNSSLSEAEDGSVLVSVVDGSYTVSTSTKINHLVQYFIANLALTLFNKALMNVVRSSLHCHTGTVRPINRVAL